MLTPEHSEQGIVHALLFASEGDVRELGWNGVRAWQPAQGLLWLHLDLRAEQTREWIGHESGVPPLAAQALVATETRPRTTTFGDGLIVQLRGVNLNPGADPEDMVSIRLWVEGERMISTRHRRLLSVQDTAKAARERPPVGVGKLLATLADRLVERMSDVIDQLEERVAALEERALQQPDHKMRSELAALRREAITLRRYLAPQREALARIHAETVAWLSDGDRLQLREVNDRLIRYLEDLDAARERAAVVHEELMSSLSEQLNSRMYVLSMAAAVFLPLGFLTGLLGINVGGIPGAESPWGFVTVILILGGILGAQIFYFYKKHWF